MKLPIMDLSVPFEVFQNIGVWGLDGSSLDIDCGKDLTELEVFIDTNTPEFLNIRAIEIYSSNDDRINLSECISKAVMSSNYHLVEDGSLDVKDRLLSGKLIHSRYECRPSIKVTFKSPIHVKAIKIFNRADIYGLRSRYIAINGFSDDKRCFEFKNVPNDLKSELYSELMGVLEKYNKPIMLPSDNSSSAKYIRNVVAECILDGELVTDQLVTALLPVNSPSPRLDKLSAIHISNYIDDKLKGRAHINTRELKKFSSILCDDVSVDQLSKFATEYLANENGQTQKVVIAKHRIHFDSLVSKREAHLNFLDEILSSLKKIDAEPLIAYGTLLGAYRDGSFLPADDDVDMILYFPGVKSHQEKEEVKNGLLSYLKSNGFSANFQPGCPHITVNSKTDALGVDIFPAWDAGNNDKIEVVMEQLKFRDVCRETLFPASEIKLYGRKYPAPASVEAFLSDRYGEGWYRSNPYHEWSWNLIRRAYFNDDSLSKLYDQRELDRNSRSSRTKTQLIAWSQCVSRTNRPPSNSIPMLLQAIEYGYDVVELDIRCSKDGVVIVAHDEIIENSSGDSINISNSNASEIVKFKLGEFQGENIFIPTLEQALPYLKNKKVLLDARFSAQDYSRLQSVVDKVGFNKSQLLFCVYNAEQIIPLMRNFTESLYFWKFYTQAWEIDELQFEQVRQYGVDGVMYMYPHYDEDISKSLYNIRKNDLQSMCFIHGQNWTPSHSSGLNPELCTRSKDDYRLSLRKMIAQGIEYVTSIDCKSQLEGHY